MASAADLKFVLSGGAANTDPLLALGGAISTAAGGVILSQSITASTIAGVTYNDAAGNVAGTGTVTYTTAGTTLQWTPPGGAIGPAVNVGVTGDYTIYGADGIGQIKVSIVSGSLAGNATQSVTIAYQTNKLFDDIAVSESSVGDTEYRCCYVKNAHAADSMTGVLLWIDIDPVGPDSLEIGVDPIGKNGVATTIATEGTAPTGVAFTAPSAEGTALSLGTLAFGDFYPVWVKRIVPVVTSGTVADTSRLKARFV